MISPKQQSLSMTHKSHNLDTAPQNYRGTGFLAAWAVWPVTTGLNRKPAQTTSKHLQMGLPVLERRRMPKSQLEVMSMDWERSQVWLSAMVPLSSLREVDSDDPQLPPGTRVSWHFSRSTSWSIKTISHIPVSSLVTWDCLMWAKIIAGLSRKAIFWVLQSRA